MPSAVTTPVLDDFFTLIALDAVGSTNDEARERAEAGAPVGTVVWAKQQLSGRGRRGRAWQSPVGNLYCSIILRPEAPPNIAAQLSFVTALALGEGVHEHLPSPAALRYKWPNDVLIDGGKIAGILLESQIGERGNMDWVVIGTGINVAMSPSDAERPATSLRHAGVRLGVEEVLAVYTRALRHWVSLWEKQGFEPVREAWLRRAIGLGEPIEVRLPNETFSGTFDALDDTGALVLGTPDGSRLVSAGEVYVQG